MFLNFSLSGDLNQPVVLSESFEQVLAQVGNLEGLAHSGDTVKLEVAADVSYLYMGTRYRESEGSELLMKPTS